MQRSDRIYLSKFALDPDPDYLDLDDFDLDCGEYDEAFHEDIVPGDGKGFAKQNQETNLMAKY